MHRQRALRTDLKIRQIGLILVAVPLVFELVFVGALTYTVQMAEKEIRRQEHAKDITFCASAITTYATQCAANIGGYSLSQGESFRAQYRENRMHMLQAFGRLDELLAEDAGHRALAAEARRSADDGIKLLDEVMGSIERGYGSRDVIESHGRFSRVKRIIDGMHVKLRAIVTAERNATSDSPQKEERLRQLILIFLGAGIATNIAIAVGLAFFFSSQITAKISRISQNAARVPRDLALEPALDGPDELSRLDRDFHEMADQLRDARKMQQYLMAMVSHDLRSPLTSLQGVLTLLTHGAAGELPEAAARKVAMAEADVGRLIKLTNDLLDTERLSSGCLDLSIVRAMVGDLLDEGVESVATFAMQNAVTVQVDPGESDCIDMTIEVDGDRIVQVLANLANNAIKYSPRGGRVVLTARKAGGADRHSACVRFSVADEGRGVRRAQQEAIFERFVQVEEADARVLGGKGLGLSICKSIVEAHGGTIGVLSEAGRGSIFWFQLPVRQAKK